jgi:hypothetical protein
MFRRGGTVRIQLSVFLSESIQIRGETNEEGTFGVGFVGHDHIVGHVGAGYSPLPQDAIHVNTSGGSLLMFDFGCFQGQLLEAFPRFDHPDVA